MVAEAVELGSEKGIEGGTGGGIGEDLVGGFELLEGGMGEWVVGVFIGVGDEGFGSVGLLDFVFGQLRAFFA